MYMANKRNNVKTIMWCGVTWYWFRGGGGGAREEQQELARGVVTEGKDLQICA